MRLAALTFSILLLVNSCQFGSSFKEQDLSEAEYDETNLINQKLGFLNDQDQIIWAKRVIGIDNKLLITKTPLDWSINPAFERLNKKEYLAKYVPLNQDLDDWQKLMTIKVIKNTNISVNSYLNDQILENQIECKDIKFDYQIYDQFDDYTLAKLNCGERRRNFREFFSLKKDLKTSIYQIHKIDNNIYITSFSWKKTTSRFDQANKAAKTQETDDFIKNITQSFVCMKNSTSKKCSEYQGLFN